MDTILLLNVNKIITQFSETPRPSIPICDFSSQTYSNKGPYEEGQTFLFIINTQANTEPSAGNRGQFDPFVLPQLMLPTNQRAFFSGRPVSLPSLDQRSM